MTLGQFWIEYHTPISLAVGILLTLVFFKIRRIKTPIRLLLVFVLMFLLTGLSGVLKYVGLLSAVAAVLYGAFISIYGLGLIAIFWYAASSGWDLTWWQIFLIGAFWYPISMLLDVGILFTVVFTIRALDITFEKFPNRVKRRLETYEE